MNKIVEIVKNTLGKINRFKKQRLNYSPEEQEDFPVEFVALCLIVPASALKNLGENDPINISDIEKLIDNASYFLCTHIDEADYIWKLLQTTNEDIKTVNVQREVYIRINISDGEEMIGKKIPYILKRNLPPYGAANIIKLACLKYLSVSGLEKFNRV
ncbi:hypothetical protein [Nostoc sp.]|uniref:hypothetical protein n=1 Tax=Nostoc sp. TaxID=1180 RepID=UPI002FF48FFE